MEFFLIEHGSRLQVAPFPAHRRRHFGDHIRFGQFMTAADDLLKPLTPGHHLHHQAASFRVPFPFVDDVAFFDSHRAFTPLPLHAFAFAAAMPRSSSTVRKINQPTAKNTAIDRTAQRWLPVQAVTSA